MSNLIPEQAAQLRALSRTSRRSASDHECRREATASCSVWGELPIHELCAVAVRSREQTSDTDRVAIDRRGPAYLEPVSYHPVTHQECCRVLPVSSVEIEPPPHPLARTFSGTGQRRYPPLAEALHRVSMPGCDWPCRCSRPGSGLGIASQDRAFRRQTDRAKSDCETRSLSDHAPPSGNNSRYCAHRRHPGVKAR